MVSKEIVAPIPLACPVQHYAWGCGADGLVAQLAQDRTGQPCAELWMGTHPSGPARLLHGGQLLSEHINKTLPFLFKVLSVRTALSIQAHPDKQLAERLHARDPKNYPDANHKPELAIALGPFEALCAFRLQAEVERLWAEVPELATLAQCGADIKTMFGQVMHADKERVVAAGEALLQRPNGGAEVGLFKRLWGQYPGDVGCFCVFLLNHVRLEAGQAIFLSANEPHAYIQGDCVECMAASDNVVRAGLTPKHRDLPTLLDMLTYRQVGVGDLVVVPAQTRAGASEYRVSADEFAVSAARIAHGSRSTVRIDREAVLIMLAGHGCIGDCEYKAGMVFYLPPGEHTVSAASDSHFYTAFEPP